MLIQWLSTEKGIVKFNIRIATPPKVAMTCHKVLCRHGYLLKKGDKVTVYGPFGDFFAKDTDAEMVFIGGGAWRRCARISLISLSVNSTRKISFCTVRSLREAFYVEEYDKLQEEIRTSGT